MEKYKETSQINYVVKENINQERFAIWTELCEVVNKETIYFWLWWYH